MTHVRSEFSKNVITLITGTTIAQAIPIIISPILTRLYTPQDFGVLAIFTSIVMIFGSVANARYEMAIILPEKDEDALNLFALSVLISLLVSLILLIIVLFLNDNIVQWLGNESISFWLYIAPLAVFLFALFNAFNYFNTRLKQFKLISKVNIFKALSAAFVQLGYGLLKGGAGGLIIGRISANFVIDLFLFRKSFKNYSLKTHISLASMFKLLKVYIDFPKFNVLATLSNTMSNNLINLLISSFYSLLELGHYSFLSRIMNVPATLISKSISQVYHQKATEEKNAIGNARKILKTTIQKLTLISLLIFPVLYFSVENLFVFVFGTEWAIAGVYAKIMTPFFLMRFVVSPVSVTFSIFEKQKIALIWQLGLLILALSVFSFSVFYDLAFENFLHIFTWTLFIYYFILYLVVKKIASGNLV